MLANGQLVGAVFAPFGTMAERVMEEMRALNKERSQEGQGLSLEYVAYAGAPPMVGLVLEPSIKRSSSFSLKYRLGGYGALIIPIGEKLPERRVRHVAESVLAMIARGTSWSDKSGQRHQVAYGPERSISNHKRRRRQFSRQSGRARSSLYF